jgi:RND superfamily putative drug exporter
MPLHCRHPQRGSRRNLGGADNPSFAVPIILFWLALTVIVSVAVPTMEQVEKEHSVSLVVDDAPSFKAIKRMAADFNESDSGAMAIIVLEGQQPLADDAHKFYDSLIRQLEDDPKHV